MTSPDHMEMAPTCGTPAFDIFLKFFIRNYVKIRRKSVIHISNDSIFMYLCVCNRYVSSVRNFILGQLFLHSSGLIEQISTHKK